MKKTLMPRAGQMLVCLMALIAVFNLGWILAGFFLNDCTHRQRYGLGISVREPIINTGDSLSGETSVFYGGQIESVIYYNKREEPLTFSGNTIISGETPFYISLDKGLDDLIIKDCSFYAAPLVCERHKKYEDPLITSELYYWNPMVIGCIYCYLIPISDIIPLEDIK